MLDEGIPVNLDPLTLIARASMKDTEPLPPTTDGTFSLVYYIYMEQLIISNKGICIS